MKYVIFSNIMYIYCLEWVSAVKSLYHTTDTLDVNDIEKFQSKQIIMDNEMYNHSIIPYL